MSYKTILKHLFIVQLDLVGCVVSCRIFDDVHFHILTIYTFKLLHIQIVNEIVELSGVHGSCPQIIIFTLVSAVRRTSYCASASHVVFQCVTSPMSMFHGGFKWCIMAAIYAVANPSWQGTGPQETVTRLR